MSHVAGDAVNRPASTASLSALGLSALGVVFGDIGTSPLYTFKTVLGLTGGSPDAATVIGVLSLVVWTLIIITTLKYVSVAMRIDNDGEGGILALMSLLGVKRRHRPAIIAVGLFGAALIYGDGAITPAISVLSALEGLEIVLPTLASYVLPVSVLILVILFAIQPQGTSRIGRTFGPIMALWFAVIALLGIWGIYRYPSVLFAIDPRYAVSYLVAGGAKGFLVLGGVFLCVTGAEALYADMGHFGARPVRLAWSGVVFPSLVLNYAGQAALVLDGAPISDNIFYRLCPSLLQLPLVALATIATIVASQSIITGAYSMTRQAIQLGWLPRMHITQTSAEGYGQIYVGTVNWLLMLVTLGLMVGFGKSDNLASAYGIAVAATMLMTSALLFIALHEIWEWSVITAGAVAGAFFLVDAAFFAANITKVAEGGYVPLLLAALVYGVMVIWHLGARAVTARIQDKVTPVEAFVSEIAKEGIPRVPGTAVFLTRTHQGVPPVMVWHVKHNRALHEKLLVLTVTTQSVPWIGDTERLTFDEIAPCFWRATGRYGFMERPDIPALLQHAHALGCGIDLSDVTYYVGHETVVPDDHHNALLRAVAALFAFMQRNSAHVTDYFKLPIDAVVEIGREVSI
ncbi:MAG: KUP/HAK/KT family potassium transporter [Alphaproteobacteria bacterium]|nr:KUP/HAK/KT family potassium transporter [Alphaproteobacteria bacterium]